MIHLKNYKNYNILLNESNKNCLEVGDLIFNKNVGNSGLCGLVVSGCESDEDGHYHKVYYRGYSGDILYTYDDDIEEINTSNIHILNDKNDISAYESISKKIGVVLNPKYRMLLDDIEDEND